MASYRESHKDRRVSENYDKKFTYRVDSLVWENFVKPFVSKELERSVNEGKYAFLDFACGTGRLTKLGYSIFGAAAAIDISENMLKEARKRVPEAEFYCVDVTRDNTGGIGMFDCVTMFRFLRNAEPELRAEALMWLSGHVSRGGVLIVNNHGHTASLQGLVARLAFWQSSEKRNLLSKRQTYAMLEEAGFSVVSCTGFRVLPSIYGRPLLGRWLQNKIERLCIRLGLGCFGGELVIVARKN